MSVYTPDTDEVRDCYDPTLEERFKREWWTTDEDGNEKVLQPQHMCLAARQEFDRWRAQHDEQVNAEAWNEGYKQRNIDGMLHQTTPNPYKKRKKNNEKKNNHTRSNTHMHFCARGMWRRAYQGR